MSAASQLEFVQLLTSHQGRLYAYLLSLLGDPEHARDVMQETNAVLWKKADEFESGSNFGAWMLKTAWYQVMAHRQKLNRDRLVFDDRVAAQLTEAAADRNEGVEARHGLLRDCLTRLNERHRELIRARYQDEATLAQLAEAFDRSTSAIKQTLFRTRASLIDCVRSRMSEVTT